MFKKLLNLIFFFSIISSVFCQSKWLSKNDKITIPFELTHNLIIAEVIINDVPLKMLLDTGSDKNLLFSFPENDSITFNDSRKVKIKGLGDGEYIEAIISKNNTLGLNGYYDDDVEVLLITDQNISLVNKLGIPINGIIGASFFKDYIVEINYQRKKIILHKNSNQKVERKLKKYTKKNIEIVGDKPYFDISCDIDDGATLDLKLLIDTGLGDGLWLFESDSIKCKQFYITDILGRGLGGDIKGKKSRVDKLVLNNFILKQALVSYPNKQSFKQLDITKGRNGSLGGEIIKRFNWFFDYQNEVFYFKKNRYFNEPFNYNMSGIEIQHTGVTWVTEKNNYRSVGDVGYSQNNGTNSNKTFVFGNNLEVKYKFVLKPVFEIYSVRENSPAAIAGLVKGDILYAINGKEAYNYSIQKITELFQSEEGKTIKIQVQRYGRILDFKFKLKKIL